MSDLRCKTRPLVAFCYETHRLSGNQPGESRTNADTEQLRVTILWTPKVGDTRRMT